MRNVRSRVATAFDNARASAMTRHQNMKVTHAQASRPSRFRAQSGYALVGTASPLSVGVI